jgi:ubiquinone/menaquinone biosynthesis C-methylase UbiE
MAARLWSSGEVYEPYVGRWSRRVAPVFLEWLEPRPDARWLDVGCGTGALSSQILATYNPRGVLGIDQSPGFVAHARGTMRDDLSAFVVADAQAIPVREAAVDYVVSGLVLNFVPDVSAVLAQARRVCRDGGVVGAYVWDYADGMQLMRYFWDAATRLDPKAAELDESRRFPICQPDRLAEAFTAAGFDRVEATGLVVPTLFRDFEDYWTPFLGGQAPAPAYCMSLDEDARGRLREELRASLPISADGTIELAARAWAVRGRVG